MTTNHEPDRLELIPLSSIAAELSGSPTVDALARNLAGDVLLDAVGRRCVSAELATVLLDDARRRRDEATERAHSHAAAVREARRTRPRRVVGGVPASVVERLVDSTGLTPAHALTMLDGQPHYDGDLGIPRPSDNPFTYTEGGGTIGPRRRPRRTKRGDQ